MVKNPPATQENSFDPWVGKMPWRRAWQPIPVFSSGESPWTGTWWAVVNGAICIGPE